MPKAKTNDKTKNLRPQWNPYFTKDNQPSWEAKSAGWDRRRESKRIMDKILEIQGLTFWELVQMMKKENLLDMTAADVICLRYVSDVVKGKHILDFLDRHISKAPQDINLGTNEDIQEIKIKVTKVNNNKK